jgi:hypothetical protein
VASRVEQLARVLSDYHDGVSPYYYGQVLAGVSTAPTVGFAQILEKRLRRLVAGTRWAGAGEST